MKAILSDPLCLQRLRGSFEWAFKSDVDGSGQPIFVSLPKAYDPRTSHALVLKLHGFTGDHLSDSFDSSSGRHIVVCINGRAREAEFKAAAQTSVLEALEYVKTVWPIDIDRVFLVGTSSGGGHGLRLAATFPGVFAGVMALGSAFHQTRSLVENLTYAAVAVVMSEDDTYWSAAEVEGTLNRITEFGGVARFFKSAASLGFHHQVWRNVSLVEEATEWLLQHKRVCSRDARSLRFLTTPSNMKCFWIEVGCVGPIQAEGYVNAQIMEQTITFETLSNVMRLTVDVEASPCRCDRHLLIVWRNQKIVIDPPFRKVFVELSCGELRVASLDRPYVPWSSQGLDQFFRSKVVIVYGSSEQWLHEFATFLSTHSSLMPYDQTITEMTQRLFGDTSAMMVGRIEMRCHEEVTFEDICAAHVILLGRGEQNRIVRAIERHLPAKIEGERLVFNDGEAVQRKDSMFGVVFPSPLNAEKRFFWFAAERFTMCTAFSFLRHFFSRRVDCIVMKQKSIVLVRSYDENGRWQPRDSSQKIPKELNSPAQIGRALCMRFYEGVAAHCYVVSEYAGFGATERVFEDGTTTWSDLMVLDFPAVRLYPVHAANFSLKAEPHKVIDGFYKGSWAFDAFDVLVLSVTMHTLRKLDRFLQCNNVYRLSVVRTDLEEKGETEVVTLCVCEMFWEILERITGDGANGPANNGSLFDEHAAPGIGVAGDNCKIEILSKRRLNGRKLAWRNGPTASAQSGT